jgi:hypothetical protein
MANPAADPQPIEDIHGDGRWMSLVSDVLEFSKRIPLADAKHTDVTPDVSRIFDWLLL